MSFNQPEDSKSVVLNAKALQLKEVLIKILQFAKCNQLNLNDNNHTQTKVYKQWGDTFATFPFSSWASNTKKH